MKDEGQVSLKMYNFGVHRQAGYYYSITASEVVFFFLNFKPQRNYYTNDCI